MLQRKVALVLKTTIALVICSILVECRKDKTGLKANKLQISHNFSWFVVHELYCFVFWLMSRHVKLRRGSV